MTEVSQLPDDFEYAHFAPLRRQLRENASISNPYASLSWEQFSSDSDQTTLDQVSSWVDSARCERQALQDQLDESKGRKFMYEQISMRPLAEFKAYEAGLESDLEPEEERNETAARLRWELSQRVELKSRLEELNKQKLKLTKDAKDWASKVENIGAKLEDICQLAKSTSEMISTVSSGNSPPQSEDLESSTERVQRLDIEDGEVDM